MIKLKSLIKEATLQDFQNLANQQRGEPEDVMVKTQFIIGGGVMSFVIEHCGDLIHRMSEYPSHNAGYESVKEKVEKVLRTLESGFMEKFYQNLINNAEVRNMKLDVFKEKVFLALKKYADVYRKLPTYNYAQMLAKRATIAIAEMNIDYAISDLKQLQRYLTTKEDWVKFAYQGLK